MFNWILNKLLITSVLGKYPRKIYMRVTVIRRSSEVINLDKKK